MDFTREPVVETVITPKEGYRLLIRSSHGENREEYSVDAIEVIAFGNSYFFRCLEKPKAFLLPLAEYEVIEIKEARPVLKKPVVDKPIKIGKKSKIAAKKNESTEEEESKRKRAPRKRREKKSSGERAQGASLELPEEESFNEKKQAAAPVKRTLLPPPTSLISEQISRYKDYLKKQGVVVVSEEEENSDIPLEEDKIDPFPQDDEMADFDLPFGGEKVIPQEPSIGEDDDPDLFTQEDKIVDIHKESKASMPPLEGEDS
ncbi:MAG: hypothetical protein AAF443_08230 [Chlamydiota bacterium]